MSIQNKKTLEAYQKAAKNYLNNSKIVASTYKKSIEMEVNKITGNPTNIVIKDKDKREQICIVYNDIEIY